MDDLEFVGKMNPRPFLSLRMEEEIRIKEIKDRLSKDKTNQLDNLSKELDLVHERDIQEEY